MKYSICMLIFPGITSLDFVGPYEVFNKTGLFDIAITSEKKGEIISEGGLTIMALHDFETCPDTDILFVPGGSGITSTLADKKYQSFLRRHASKAKYITSVCTGSLLLATSGLLNGYRATTHWRSLSLLKMFDIDVVEDRVVVDRNRITGAGVTSGIDFALTLVALIDGELTAKIVQLGIEYDPLPPFTDGSPKTSSSLVITHATERSQVIFDTRKKIIEELLKK